MASDDKSKDIVFRLAYRRAFHSATDSIADKIIDFGPHVSLCTYDSRTREYSLNARADLLMAEALESAHYQVYPWTSREQIIARRKERGNPKPNPEQNSDSNLMRYQPFRVEQSNRDLDAHYQRLKMHDERVLLGDKVMEALQPDIQQFLYDCVGLHSDMHLLMEQVVNAHQLALPGESNPHMRTPDARYRDIVANTWVVRSHRRGELEVTSVHRASIDSHRRREQLTLREIVSNEELDYLSKVNRELYIEAAPEQHALPEGETGLMLRATTEIAKVESE